MRTRARRLVAAGALLVVLPGCAARYTMVPLQPLSAELPQTYTSIVLLVESRTPLAPQETLALGGQAIARIRALGDFESAQLGEAANAGAGTLVVKVSVIQVNRVDQFTRFMAGAFAGRASVAVEVSYIDGPSQRTLGTYYITGESGGTGVSGGTDDAVSKVAQGIAEVLHRDFGKGQASVDASR